MPQEDPIKLWQHFHGATVHFALALTLVSLVFDLGSKIFGKRDWRTVGFWSQFVAALLSIPAVVSGLWGQLGWFHADKWEADHLLQHRNLALIGTGCLLLLFGWRCLTSDFGISRNRQDRKAGNLYLVYLALMLIAASTIGYTGYLGSYVARGY